MFYNYLSINELWQLKVFHYEVLIVFFNIFTSSFHSASFLKLPQVVPTSSLYFKRYAPNGFIYSCTSQSSSVNSEYAFSLFLIVAL